MTQKKENDAKNIRMIMAACSMWWQAFYLQYTTWSLCKFLGEYSRDFMYMLKIPFYQSLQRHLDHVHSWTDSLLCGCLEKCLG